MRAPMPDPIKQDIKAASIPNNLLSHVCANAYPAPKIKKGGGTKITTQEKKQEMYIRAYGENQHCQINKRDSLTTT
jgi:hypothetical protein